MAGSFHTSQARLSPGIHLRRAGTDIWDSWVTSHVTHGLSVPHPAREFCSRKVALFFSNLDARKSRTPRRVLFKSNDFFVAVQVSSANKGSRPAKLLPSQTAQTYLNTDLFLQIASKKTKSTPWRFFHSFLSVSDRGSIQTYVPWISTNKKTVMKPLRVCIVFNSNTTCFPWC